MWKRLSVLCVILVIFLVPLAALPPQVLTWLTGEIVGEDQLKLELENKEALIESQMQYIAELESLLEEQNKDSAMLVEKLQTSEEKVKSLETKSETLQRLLVASKSEIEQLKTLSEISKTDLEVKQEEIASLSEDIVTVEQENIEYYANERPDWGGLIGGGATWDPTTGLFGATVDMGVRYKNWALVTGVEYKPSVWKLALPEFSDLSFSTGVQWSF